MSEKWKSVGWGRGTAVQNIRIEKAGAGSGSKDGSAEAVWDDGGQESKGGGEGDLRIEVKRETVEARCKPDTVEKEDGKLGQSFCTKYV